MLLALRVQSAHKYSSEIQIIMNLSKGIQEQNLQWRCEQLTRVKERFHRVIFKENKRDQDSGLWKTFSVFPFSKRGLASALREV